MKLVLVILTVFAAALLAGCGGGNGSNNGNGSTDTLDSRTTRVLQHGESVNYNVTGTVTEAGETKNVTGTASIRTRSSDMWTPKYGTSTVQQETEIHLNGIGNSIVVGITKKLEQSQDGTIYLIGRNDGYCIENLEISDHPPVLYPGTFVVGNTWSYCSIWDGTKNYMEAKSTCIHPSELVAGHQAYRIHTTSTRDDSTTQTDEWFSPGLGYPIKTNVVIDGSTIDFNLTLTFITKSF